MAKQKSTDLLPKSDEEVESTDVDNTEFTETIEEVATEEDAQKVVAMVQQANANTALEIKPTSVYNLDVKSFEDLTLGAQLAIFKEMSTDPQTGIANPAMGLLKFQRAKELKIPWANAVSHMHIIKNRVGIDINICQAILQRPGSGVTWEYEEDHSSVYNYIDANGNVYIETSFPPNVIKVDTFKDMVPAGKVGVILMPTFVNNKPVYLPVDYRTVIKFTRKKKDIDGQFITVSERGVFSWQDACTAKLPYTSGTTILDPNSNWAKRPKFMVYKSAFWDGAKKIANDLLMGADDIDALNSIDN